MKPLFALSVLLITSVIARADMVIVQKIDGAGQSGQMTMSINGNKIRTDVNPQMSTITDADSGDVTTLMHTQKMFLVIPAATAKAMASQAMQSATSGTAAGTPSAPKATGKTDKINGYKAAEYTYSNGNIKATYWISSEFPNYKAVVDALSKFQKGGLAAMTKDFTPDMSVFPGVPLKTEVEFNGQKITTVLVSAADQTVDPGQYKVPADYQEMKLPDAPQPPQ